MTTPATAPHDGDVAAFLSASARPAEGAALNTLFQSATGYTPHMWGPSIVGFGRYDYTYKSGRTGTWLATGFSPRKANLSVYIMPGYQDYSAILSRLGPHKMGKSCLYIKRLDQIDQSVLAELIQTGLRDLAAMWPVRA